jgi:hypothetical protein
LYKPEIAEEVLSEILAFAINYCSEKDRSWFVFNKNHKFMDRMEKYKPHIGNYYRQAVQFNELIGKKLEPAEIKEVFSNLSQFFEHTETFLKEKFNHDSYDDYSDMDMPTSVSKA